jgi:hypothetical protein
MSYAYKECYMKGLDRQHAEVFEALTAHRDSPVSGRLFALAIKMWAVAEYLADEISLDDLSNLIDGYADMLQKDKEVRSENRAATSGQAPSKAPADNRARAIQRILALEIAADETVLAFRADHLATGLLGMDEVAQWIEQAANAERTPTIWITMAQEALDDAISSGIQTPLDRVPGYSDHHEDLKYLEAEARHPQSVPVRVDGVLGDLAAISQRIAKWYEWDEAAATTFVLTGLPPAPRGANASKIEPWPWPDARRRIELDIPISTTPEEVAALYRRVREDMLGDEPRGRRSLTEWTADLAVFAAEHSSGYTWEEARAIWNRKHKSTPSYPSRDPAQFIRDSRSAYERVAGGALDWRGKKADGTLTTKDQTRGK